MDTSNNDLLIELTADIVTAHVANNDVQVDALPSLIENVYGSLSGLTPPSAKAKRPEPAVSVRASVKDEHIVCLEDGKKMKMLKRHLMTDHGMTPAEYRERWNLASDYPMVAPAYAEQRRQLAKDIGLGRKPGESPRKK